MNNLRNAATEIVSNELIYRQKMTAIKKSISVFTGKPVDAGFSFFCDEPKKTHRMFYPDSRR